MPSKSFLSGIVIPQRIIYQASFTNWPNLQAKQRMFPWRQPVVLSSQIMLSTPIHLMGLRHSTKSEPSTGMEAWGRRYP